MLFYAVLQLGWASPENVYYLLANISMHLFPCHVLYFIIFVELFL